MGVVGMGCGQGVGWWGGEVCCLLEVPQGCSCQVNILECTLEGVKTIVGKHIRRKFVPLCYCSGKKLYLWWQVDICLY